MMKRVSFVIPFVAMLLLAGCEENENAGINALFNAIPMYQEIQFELSGEVLFKAITWACGFNSQIFNDLVLYYDLENEKFYLHDSYPEHILTELAKENKEKRVGAWRKFVDQLRTEGRLKE